MPAEHYIAMDTHSYSTDICVKTRANTPGRRWRVASTIPALRQVIESVRRPRHIAFEEGGQQGDRRVQTPRRGHSPARLRRQDAATFLDGKAAP